MEIALYAEFPIKRAEGNVCLSTIIINAVLLVVAAKSAVAAYYALNVILVLVF